MNQNLGMKIKVAGVGLMVVDVAVRLAVEELAIDIQPTGGIRREQGFAVGARSANTVSRQQAVQVQGLAEDGRGGIAEIHQTRILIEALIALESRAPLFQRHVKTGLFESDAAAIQIRGIAQGIGNRVFIAVRDKNRRTSAGIRVWIASEVAGPPMPRLES